MSFETEKQRMKFPRLKLPAGNLCTKHLRGAGSLIYGSQEDDSATIKDNTLLIKWDNMLASHLLHHSTVQQGPRIS